MLDNEDFRIFATACFIGWAYIQIRSWVFIIADAVNFSRVETNKRLGDIKDELRHLQRELDKCNKHLNNLDNHFCSEKRAIQRKLIEEYEKNNQVGSKP